MRASPCDAQPSERQLGEVAPAVEDQRLSIGHMAAALDLADELSPCVVRPAEDKSYVAVIMPMRI